MSDGIKICDCCGLTYDSPECPYCNRVTDKDRIEELEAKLAKAACFITDIEAGPSWGESLPSWVNNRMLKATTTIAELKGQDGE